MTHHSASILGPYGGGTLNKLQYLVLKAHSLPLSVQNEIPKVEKNSSTANSVGYVRSRIPHIADSLLLESHSGYLKVNYEPSKVNIAICSRFN